MTNLDADNANSCEMMRLQNALFWVPLSIFPTRFLLDQIVLMCNHRLNFARNIKVGLKILFVFGIAEIIARFFFMYYFNIRNIEEPGLGPINETFVILDLFFIVIVCVAQSFITLKLSHLLYILPKEYRWIMMYSQASAAIFSSLIYSLHLTIYLFTNNPQVVHMCVLGVLICVWVLFLVQSLKATNILITNAMILDSMQVFIDDQKLNILGDSTGPTSIQSNDYLFSTLATEINDNSNEVEVYS